MPPHLPLTENKIAALVVGAMVGCEDGPVDAEDNINEVATDVEIDDDSADEVDTDVELDFSASVTDVEPARLAEAWEEGDGALELPLRLDALALDP
jgi:hypothetical protein